MTQTIQKRLSDSALWRWVALVIVSVTMMFGYFFTDVMSPLEPLLTLAKDQGGLGWSSDEYGFFSGSYGFFNVFLLLLFFGGIILDKFGIRFTGVLSTVLMFVGALIKWWALKNTFEGELFGYQMQVIYACLGFATYGVGCEIAGITVSKVLVKWFTGHELALAMGLQVGLARLGTAAALSFALPFAKKMGGVSASVGLGAALLCAGVVAIIIYNILDKKEDKIEYEKKSYEWNGQNKLVLREYIHQYTTDGDILIDYINYDENGSEISRETRDSSGNLVGDSTEPTTQEQNEE